MGIVKELEQEIQAIKEEILRTSCLPNFILNDKQIDFTGKIESLQKLLRLKEQQLKEQMGLSIYQGPDREIY